MYHDVLNYITHKCCTTTITTVFYMGPKNLRNLPNIRLLISICRTKNLFSARLRASFGHVNATPWRHGGKKTAILTYILYILHTYSYRNILIPVGIAPFISSFLKFR